EANDLVVAEPLHRVVHPSLIEPEPVVVRLAVGPDAEAVTVHADPRPLPEPGTDLGPGSDACERLRLEVERKDPCAHRAAARRPAIGPRLGRRWRAVQADLEPAVAIEGGLDAVRGLLEKFRSQLAGVLRELVGLEHDGEVVELAERRAEP